MPSVGLVASEGADIVAAALKSAGIVNPTRRQRRTAAKFYRKQLKARVRAGWADFARDVPVSK